MALTLSTDQTSVPSMLLHASRMGKAKTPKWYLQRGSMFTWLFWLDYCGLEILNESSHTHVSVHLGNA